MKKIIISFATMPIAVKNSTTICNGDSATNIVIIPVW